LELNNDEHYHEVNVLRFHGMQIYTCIRRFGCGFKLAQISWSWILPSHR